jgi:hypothetical protein
MRLTNGLRASVHSAAGRRAERPLKPFGLGLWVPRGWRWANRSQEAFAQKLGQVVSSSLCLMTTFPGIGAVS